ncbi:MAG: hypothetical protein ACO3K7_06375, partial [Candidatus Marinamargulisbacteria bacterium]
MTPIVHAALPFELEADHIRIDNKNNTVAASGNVVILYQNYSISSNNMHYSKDTKQLSFTNATHVKDEKNNTLLADRVVIHLTDDNQAIKKSTIKNGIITTNRNVIITGQTIELTPTGIIIYHCTITTCTAQRPEWQFKSDELSMNQTTDIIHAKNNRLEIYGIPVFFIPLFSQNIEDEDVSNRPSTEIGYKPIDHLFANVSLGYMVTDTLSGRVGIGASTGRGFRYGTTQVYAPQKNHVFFLDTYDVAKTGFEGGLQYRWTQRYNQDDTNLLSTLFINQTNQPVKTTLMVDYRYNNATYNELYDALPEIKLMAQDIGFYADTLLNGHISTGYYVDRITNGQRHEILVGVEKKLIETPTLSILNSVSINAIDYPDQRQSWHRFINHVTLSMPFYGIQNKLTYSKM